MARATMDSHELNKLNKYIPLHQEFSQSCRKLYNKNCNISLEKRVQNAFSFCKNKDFLPYKQYTEQNDSSLQESIDHLILKEAGIKDQTESFDDNERIFCLKLFVSQSNYYGLLSAIFKLPSRVYMIRLLDRVDYKAGFNEEIFKKINKSLTGRRDEEKICVLILEDIFVLPELHYNDQLDRMVGIEDFVDVPEARFGYCVNLFMLQSLYQKEGVVPWNQPVYYALGSYSMKPEITVEVIKQLLNESFKYGIEVVAFVCDGYSDEQVEAINLLLEETRSKIESLPQDFNLGSISFQDKEIVPLYDVSYILLNLRNGFFDYNVHYLDGSKQQVAEWKHIINVFEQDKPLCNRNNLTEEMVHKSYIVRNKISDALQLFDHKNGKLISKKHPKTGKLVQIIADLYDSLNSCNATGNGERDITGGLRKDSSHLTVWEEGLKVLASIKFHCPKNDEFFENSRAIIKLMTTLRGFIRLRNKLLFEKGFDYIATRLLSNDTVRNLFPEEQDSYKFRLSFLSYILIKPSCGFSQDNGSVIVSHLLTTLPELILQPEIDPPFSRDNNSFSFERLLQNYVTTSTIELHIV